MALNDVFECAVGMTQDGCKIVNVIHLRQTSADVALPPNEDAAKSINDSLWVPAYRAAVCNELSLQTVRAKRVHPTAGGTYIHTVDDAGTVADDPLPPNACVVLAMYSTSPSRSGRGRIHISGIPDGWHKDGIIDVANVASYAAIITALLGVFQSGAGATFEAGLFNATTTTFTAFDSGVVRSHTYTLRSRRMENP